MNIFRSQFARALTITGKYKTFSDARWFGQPAAQTHPHLIQDGEVTPGISRQEFRMRRYNLMSAIAETAFAQHFDHHIVIIPSATKLYMTNDIPYQFRQNTDFLYFSGFQEPDSLLLIESSPGNLPEHKSVLFVPKKDPAKELWEGARSGVEGAKYLTGVDEVHITEDIDQYLNKYLSMKKQAGKNRFVAWYDHKTPTHVQFHNKHIADFLTQNREGFTEIPKSLMHKVRLIKSKNEIVLMKEACIIASQAFSKVMKFSKPGIPEAHLFAKMDYECRIRGADYLAYPPVVAGGKRANTIHYINNNQIVSDGEMVLMDAGCEYHGYSSDVTRTWPVNGKFSEPQKILYEALLEIQKICVEECIPVNSMQDNYSKMLALISEKLHQIGIFSTKPGTVSPIAIAREFCPHHLGHYLGMDIHDTDSISRSIPLQEGMVLTVEPGIYVPHTRTDVHEEFRGIGLRIEDDVLVTGSEPDVLTRSCPKEWQEIENLMESR